LPNVATQWNSGVILCFVQMSMLYTKLVDIYSQLVSIIIYALSYRHVYDEGVHRSGRAITATVCVVSCLLRLLRSMRCCSLHGMCCKLVVVSRRVRLAATQITLNVRPTTTYIFHCYTTPQYISSLRVLQHT